jgi:hypothetical protein
MTVRVNKSPFNLREKLSELTSKFGLKGTELARAETVQDARDLVSAGRKNLIQNGDFRVNQRGESTYTTISGSIFDRWKFQKDLISEYTHNVTQSSDAPDGFNNSLRLEVTTSETSVDASDDLCLTQHVEGQNCQALRAGTDSAKPFTLSFWVKSTRTGIYSVTATVEGSPVKIFSTTYSVNQASTWEYKVVKFPPCPQTIADNTSGNLTFRWILIAGSNYTSASSGNMNEWDDYHSSLFAGGHKSQIATDGDVWQLTGVQVEESKNATDFEYRPIGEELALCQRYYWQTDGVVYMSGYGGSPQTYQVIELACPSTMRATPTVTISTTSAGSNFSAGSNSPQTIHGFAQTTGTSGPRGKLQASAEL